MVRHGDSWSPMETEVVTITGPKVVESWRDRAIIVGHFQPVTGGNQLGSMVDDGQIMLTTIEGASDAYLN